MWPLQASPLPCQLVVPQADTLSAIQLRNGVPATTRPELGPGYRRSRSGREAQFFRGLLRAGRPTPISYQYNLNIQHELRGNTVVEVGLHGECQPSSYGQRSQPESGPSRVDGPGDSQARRPFPQFSNVSILNAADGKFHISCGLRQSREAVLPRASRFWLTTHFRSSSMT